MSLELFSHAFYNALFSLPIASSSSMALNYYDTNLINLSVIISEMCFQIVLIIIVEMIASRQGFVRILATYAEINE